MKDSDELLAENKELKELLYKAIIRGGHSTNCKNHNMHPLPDDNCICHVKRAKELINKK